MSSPEIKTEHKPLIRTTITLIFPNLGSAVVTEHVANLIAEAMECGARETFVTIIPEDEQEDDDE